MRVTENMRYDQIRDNLGQNRLTSDVLYNKIQAATQKGDEASDDPEAGRPRVLNERLIASSNSSKEKSLNYALNF